MRGRQPIRRARRVAARLQSIQFKACIMSNPVNRLRQVPPPGSPNRPQGVCSRQQQPTIQHSKPVTVTRFLPSIGFFLVSPCLPSGLIYPGPSPAHDAPGCRSRRSMSALPSHYLQRRTCPRLALLCVVTDHGQISQSNPACMLSQLWRFAQPCLITRAKLRLQAIINSGLPCATG